MSYRDDAIQSKIVVDVENSSPGTLRIVFTHYDPWMFTLVVGDDASLTINVDTGVLFVIT